jgi:hypothetical protein
MKKVRLITTTAIAALLSMVPSLAHARSTLGLAAVGFAAADRSCFSISYDRVVNSCSTQANFVWPIVADTSGSKTFTITAQGSSSSDNVQCLSVGVNQDFTAVWTSGYATLPAFGSPQNIVQTVSTPNLGGYYVQCWLDAGTSVDIINFTP